MAFMYNFAPFADVPVNVFVTTVEPPVDILATLLFQVYLYLVPITHTYVPSYLLVLKPSATTFGVSPVVQAMFNPAGYVSERPPIREPPVLGNVIGANSNS